MANEFKVTIPEAGYYSCGTYTDHRGKTVPHLQWVGETIPDNFESTENLWFFKYGEEVAPETIIIYPWGERLEKAAEHYFEETYLDIEDEQVFDRIEDSSEQEAYTSLRDALMDDMKEFDRYDFSFPVPGNPGRPQPEPSEIELETLRSVRNRLFKLYNHVDENPEYDDYSLGLKAAVIEILNDIVIEIDKMITENSKP